jgi:PAS domain S-box-containing protein
MNQDHLLSTVTDAFPGFVSYIDREHRYRFVSQGFERITGLSREEIVGKKVSEVVGDAAYQNVIPELRKAFEGKRVSFEKTQTLKDGSTGVYKFDYVPDFDERNEVRGTTSVVTDITAKRAFERALEDSIRARDEFVSIASHELKTPLTSLKLQTQLIKQKVARGDGDVLTPEWLLKVANRSEQQVDRLTRLVEDMLDIARLRSGKLTIERSPTDLGALTRELVERLSSALIRVDVIGQWDPQRIEQVLSNLLSNAVKYGGGKAVEVSVRREGDRAILSVHDQGRGIPVELHERIFDRFERVNESQSIAGLGLGLYIVRQIVEIHGGTVRVESEPGQGSTFTVTLPL